MNLRPTLLNQFFFRNGGEYVSKVEFKVLLVAPGHPMLVENAHSSALKGGDPESENEAHTDLVLMYTRPR